MLGIAETVTIVAACLWGAVILGCIAMQLTKYAVKRVTKRA